MSVYAAPGVSVEVTVYGFATGLVGTVGVRVMDGQGGTTTARSTSGIVESPAGSGVYTATITSPSTAGQYVVVWDDTATYVPEDLVVGYTAPSVASLSGVDLCTVAQVREWLQKPGGDTAQDTVIQNTITRASRAILTYLDREVVVSGSNPQTRVVDVGGHAYTRVVPVGDMASTPTAVLILGEDGATVATLTVGTDVQALPLVRRSWEPITHLRLRDSAGTLDSRYQLSVTGSWGWPAVPEDITQAAVMTAGSWVRRYVQAFTTSYSPEAVEEGAPESIPGAARAMLRPHRAVVVA